MNTHMSPKQQLAGAVTTEMIVPEKDELVASGFTTEEIVSLLWLRQWYQTEGSDRVPSGVPQASRLEWQAGSVRNSKFVDASSYCVKSMATFAYSLLLTL